MLKKHLRNLFLPHHNNNLRAKILHASSLSMIIALFCFIQAGINFTQFNRPDILGYATVIPVQSIVDGTNAERAKVGLRPLKINDKLSDAARRKAADMLAKDYWAHNSPDGTKPWFFITSSGYSYLHAGENLARDFSDSQSIVTAWMNSKTHRDNLLAARYQEIGVAVVDGWLSGHETTLVVQMFGTPQSAAGNVTDEGSSIVRAARAAEVRGDNTLMPDTTPVPSPTYFVAPEPSHAAPFMNSFDLNRSFTLAFAVLVLSVLIIDWLIAWQQNLIRLSGKNWAHITFVATTLALALLIKQGLIL
jgi:hypothetical protein